MKNAIFKLFKVTFPFALAFMMCLPFSMTLNAASVKNIPVKKILSADITGDGKADKILITTSMDKDCLIKLLLLKTVRMTIFIPLLPDMLKCQIKMNFFS